MSESWTVNLSNRAGKQMNVLKKDRPRVYKLAVALIKELEVCGPVMKEWPHFSALSKGRGVPDNSYHCWIKRGKPVYVACWNVDKIYKIIEVYYVGTHENAPY